MEEGKEITGEKEMGVCLNRTHYKPVWNSQTLFLVETKMSLFLQNKNKTLK